MHRLIREFGFPKKLTLRGERGGAVGAEMHKDAVAFNDRGRRGVTVLGVFQVRPADQVGFNVDEFLPGCRIERENPQGLDPTLGREIKKTGPRLLFRTTSLTPDGHHDRCANHVNCPIPSY